MSVNAAPARRTSPASSRSAAPPNSHPTGLHHPRLLALADLRDRLESGLLAAIPNTHINGSTTHRAPNTTNLRFDGVDAESLLIALDMQGIAASFGAACQSGATEPSHVLLAMGLSPAEARSSLRLSLSRLTTADEIDQAIAHHPRRCSPPAFPRLTHPRSYNSVRC